MCWLTWNNYGPTGTGAINTGYNPNYLKWSGQLGNQSVADVVHKLFNGTWSLAAKQRSTCHVPNICSGNRSTLVPETSLHALDVGRATFQQ